MAEILTEELLHTKTPQQLTTLLYETCIDRLDEAIRAIHSNRYLDANRLLQKGNDILYRLGAGLNYEAGIVADQLDSLYNYMAERLIEANRNKDAGAVEEVRALLITLLEAWETALQKGTDTQPAFRKHQTMAYDRDTDLDSFNINSRE